jgi:hypothetical protein
MEDLKKIIKLQLKNLVEEVDGRDDGTYMIISNLEQMKKDIDKILSYKDSPYFHKVVTGDHAWAGDHITTSKDDVEEVSNFIEGFMEQMSLSEGVIDESKNKPTNPKLWASSLAWARSRYKVCPSAYCNGAAAKRYKSKGGKWKKTE